MSVADSLPMIDAYVRRLSGSLMGMWLFWKKQIDFDNEGLPVITFYIIKYGDKMRAGIDIVFRLSKIIVSFHRQSCKTVLNFSSLKYVEFEGSIQAIDFWFGSLDKNPKVNSMILVISKSSEQAAVGNCTPSSPWVTSKKV